MATGDLVSITRAVQNPTLLSLNNSNPALLQSLISTASVAIKSVCGDRDFLTTSYTEYASGGGIPYDTLQLRQYPVTEITRIATNPAPAMTVENTANTTNQRATVAVTSTGIKLTRVASGVSTSNTLLFASYVTISAMAAAITAVGNGWTASAISPYSLHPSSDLTYQQGAQTALNGAAYLSLYSEDRLSSLSFSAYQDTAGEFGAAGEFWRLDPETGILFGRWPRGTRNIRIDYTAGFASTPDALPADIQEAVVQHVLDLYQSGLVNQSISSATLGQASYTLKTLSESTSMSGKVIQLINSYIDYGKKVWR